jgi:ketosteroid isomerase-like protein
VTDTQTEVLAANEAFYRAFEQKNLEAMSQVWSQGTASLCIHPGRNALRGWKQIRDSWELIFKNTKYLEIEVEVITAEIRDPTAYVVLVERVLQASSGRTIKAESIATNIFEQMAGKWYLIHHHASPLVR